MLTTNRVVDGILLHVRIVFIVVVSVLATGCALKAQGKPSKGYGLRLGAPATVVARPAAVSTTGSRPTSGVINEQLFAVFGTYTIPGQFTTGVLSASVHDAAASRS